MRDYYSHAGYAGAAAVVLYMAALMYVKYTDKIKSINADHALLGVAVTFFVMITYEFFAQRRYMKKNDISFERTALHKSDIYILKSALYRFAALLVPFFIIYYIVSHHIYFTNNHSFYPAIEYFRWLLYIFAVAGVPYIYLTLKLNGNKRLEYLDYAIIALVAIRSIFVHLRSKIFKTKSTPYKFYKNRRVFKLLRIYLVNIFFLTLMVRFLSDEINIVINNGWGIYIGVYDRSRWFQLCRLYYNLFINLIFVIDVTIAAIAYSISSRWLFNRTKSVDATWSGWIVAIACYPPFNNITFIFLGYDKVPTTHALNISHSANLFLFILIVFCYLIYIWSTMALGFKFSNLSNRGIVNRGPYAILRHPSYAYKNIAWWLENTYVFTSIWAMLAMGLTNLLYILRATTEEAHLKHDKNYLAYMKKVKYRFIPKVF